MHLLFSQKIRWRNLIFDLLNFSLTKLEHGDIASNLKTFYNLTDNFNDFLKEKQRILTQ